MATKRCVHPPPPAYHTPQHAVVTFRLLLHVAGPAQLPRPAMLPAQPRYALAPRRGRRARLALPPLLCLASSRLAVRAHVGTYMCCCPVSPSALPHSAAALHLHVHLHGHLHVHVHEHVHEHVHVHAACNSDVAASSCKLIWTTRLRSQLATCHVLGGTFRAALHLCMQAHAAPYGMRTTAALWCGLGHAPASIIQPAVTGRTSTLSCRAAGTDSNLAGEVHALRRVGNTCHATSSGCGYCRG